VYSIDICFLAGSSSIVERLLKCSKVKINLADLQNQTALHYAVRGNHIQVVRLLLDKGIDPNCQDGSHAATPLIDAAALGLVGILKALLATPAIRVR
jgi:ankyrin repeat protein